MEATVTLECSSVHEMIVMENVPVNLAEIVLPLGSFAEMPEASPHKRELKCDTNISPRRLMPHLLHQMVQNRTNLGGHSIQMIMIINQATT